MLQSASTKSGRLPANTKSGIMPVELLSPVQDLVCLRAAIDAGADAVYFGTKEFNMRANAKNIEQKDLPRVIKLCHKNKVKAYLALNSIVYDK